MIDTMLYTRDYYRFWRFRRKDTNTDNLDNW